MTIGFTGDASSTKSKTWNSRVSPHYHIDECHSVPLNATGTVHTGMELPNGPRDQWDNGWDKGWAKVTMG